MAGASMLGWSLRVVRELGTAHYVLSVWEMEAWLLLFPDAVSTVASSWKVPAKYRGKDTGRLADPKRIMKREIAGTRRPYRESDAAAIFEHAVSLAAPRPDRIESIMEAVHGRSRTLQCSASPGVIVRPGAGLDRLNAPVYRRIHE